MSDFGIICEFNPLHAGHRYLIQKAKECGARRVVCVMSGNSVQRGDLAVADKYLRAQSAVSAGADLVLELPYPWCSASAERFAAGGISVVRHFADTLFFGSECGDGRLLSELAERSNRPEFRERYRSLLKTGAPAAGAYAQMLAEYSETKLGSNDLLGMEYLRSIATLGAEMDFQTVRRLGTSYTQQTITPNEFPSSTAIRTLWESGDFETSEAYLPNECAALYRRAAEEGALFSRARWEDLIFTWFRLHQGTDFEHILGAESGLGARFCSAAREAVDLSDFYERIRTKRYTDSHLHRVLLYCMTGAEAELFRTLPQYTTVLAANEKGRAILAERRKNPSFSAVTKGADAPRNTVQYSIGERVDSLFSLATERRQEASAMVKKSPHMA